MTTARQFLILTVGSLGILNGCGAGQSVYPLEEELRWEYEVSFNGKFGGNSMQMTVSTMPERNLEGHSVTPLKVELAGQTFFNYAGEAADGFYLLGEQSPSAPEPEVYDPPRYFLKRPLQVGHTWTTESQTQLVEQGTPVMLTLEIVSTDETVTVPAGTFEDCIKVATRGQAEKNMGAMALGTTATISVEGIDWYAPVVGAVRGVYKEESNHFLAGNGEINTQLKIGPGQGDD